MAIINKINSLALGSVKKVVSLAKTSIAKIKSLANFSSAYSVVLDGTNDYITAHGVAGLISPVRGSVSCWFKLNTISASDELWTLYVDASNAIRVFYHASNNSLRGVYRVGGANYPAYDATVVENNGWHHVVYTWDTSATESKLYIDGTNNDDGAPEDAIAIDELEDPFTVYIGAKAGSLTWNGNIDDFAIFDGVLTSAEVTAIYNGGGPKDESRHDHLIGYWRFENNTNNSSSNPHAITLVNGASYDSGDVSVAFDTYSILFDGTDDHLTADGAATLVGTTGSVSMWAKLEVYPHTETMFAAKIDSSNYLWLFYHGGTNQTRFEIKGEGGGEGAVEETLIATTAVENNGWHHFAFTWDTGEGQSALYIDGSSVDTGTAPALTGEQSGIDFGKRRGHAWEQFVGNMNDIALFDDVLTSGEVSAIYNSGAPKDESSHSGLIGYWKMEENTGTSVADSSSNSNVITLVNGAAWSTDVP